MLGLLELARQRVVWRQIDRPRRTIDDGGLALARLGQDAAHSGHRRDLEGPREDHAVGGLAAVLRHDGSDLVHLEPREERRQQLIDDHDRAGLHRSDVVAHAQQLVHHTLAHVGDVGARSRK